MKAKLLFAAATLFALTSILTSCGSEAETKPDTEVSKIEGVKKEDKTHSAVKLNGSLFSVSSPLESIVSIKESNAVYNESILLPTPDLSTLATNFDKAVHLGIVGADLGYSSVFEQQLKSVELFKTLKDLSTELNLNNAAPESLIQRLASNSGNKDSLMVIVSEFYRQSNQYLQENKRMEDAALILAGGWVEGMHISLDMANTDKEGAKQRIAGQRSSFKNLVNLMKNSCTDEKATALIEDFKAFEYVFENVEYSYEYEQSEVDIDTKTTRIKGNTTYNFSDETLELLREKVNALRTKLTTI